MADFKSSIAEVKLAYNIVDYIQGSGVTLKSSGGSKYKGLCPFHNEKTPSFTVDASFQNYRCFGCGANGDLIKYVELTENLEFFEALKKLAEDKNIDLQLKEERNGVDYKSLREAMREVSNFFVLEYRKLKPDHPARIEVTKRGLSESKMVYGYAPDGRKALYKHLKAKGFSDDIILLTGACVRYEDKPDIFDFWSGRLMFFITDVTGKPIGFSGRKLYESDKRGKYVNSRDGVLFDKGASLFNIALAKKKAAKTKTVYVSEGQFDVAAFVEADLTNSVASSGTAFTEKQAMMLRRLVGDDGKIVFVFDGDEAGVKAAEKVFATAPGVHSQAYVVPLPKDQDPCDYRIEHGNEGLVSYVESNQVPLVEFVLTNTALQFNMDNPLESGQYVAAAAKILKMLSNDVLRETYTKKVALESFTSIEAVKKAIAAAKLDRRPGESAVVRQAVDSEASDGAPAGDEGEAPEGEHEELTLDQKLIALIKQDEIYDMSARLVTLAFDDPALVERLSATHLPKSFGPLLEDLRANQGPIVPEAFRNTELVSYLVNSDLFPFAHLNDADIKASHFEYLAARLERQIAARKANRVKAKISQTLERSRDAGAEFLERALSQEEKYLSTHADGR